MAGISNAGFLKKNFDEIKGELEDGLRSRLGDDLNLDSTSILGQLVAIQSRQLNDLWELGANAYNSRFIQTATGQSVDRIVDLLNITREEDRSTSGVAYIYGMVGTIIPVGTTFSTDNGAIYETLREYTLVAGQSPVLNFRRNTGNLNNAFTISPANDLYELFVSADGSDSFSINYDDSNDDLKTKFETYFGADSIESINRVPADSNSIVVNFARNIFPPFFNADGMTITVNRPGLRDGIAATVSNIEPGDVITNRGELKNISSPVTGMSGVINFLETMDLQKQVCLLGHTIFVLIENQFPLTDLFQKLRN